MYFSPEAVLILRGFNLKNKQLENMNLKILKKTLTLHHKSRSFLFGQKMAFCGREKCQKADGVGFLTRKFDGIRKKIYKMTRKIDNYSMKIDEIYKSEQYVNFE